MSDIDKTLCDEAIKIVTGARREKYDVPERNFERIALAWQAITDRAYTAQEVALMFVALKLVRESHEHQRDNLVDGIGYLLCADAVVDQPKAKLVDRRMNMNGWIHPEDQWCALSACIPA